MPVVIGQRKWWEKSGGGFGGHLGVWWYTWAFVEGCLWRVEGVREGIHCDWGAVNQVSRGTLLTGPIMTCSSSLIFFFTRTSSPITRVRLLHSVV